MKYKFLLIGFITTVFVPVAVAQSGRRKTPPPSPAPPIVLSSERKEALEVRPPAKHPASIIIGGKTVVDEGYYHSSDVKEASDEIIDMFKLFRMPCKPVKGGTMTREQAIERAKQETDAYVLWLQINIKTRELTVDDVYRGDTDISFLGSVDYVLFSYRTGEIVYKGQVDPGKIVETNEHGTRIPPMNRERSRRMSPQLRASAREVFRVIRGWI